MTREEITANINRLTEELSKMSSSIKEPSQQVSVQVEPGNQAGNQAGNVDVDNIVNLLMNRFDKIDKQKKEELFQASYSSMLNTYDAGSPGFKEYMGEVDEYGDSRTARLMRLEEPDKIFEQLKKESERFSQATSNVSTASQFNSGVLEKRAELAKKEVQDILAERDKAVDEWRAGRLADSTFKSIIMSLTMALKSKYNINIQDV